MKYRMNFNIRYALPMLLLLWMALGTGSCVREDFINGNGSDNVSSVSIKVKLPEQSVQATQTRATGRDYDEVRNMNILISDKGIIKKRLYLDFAGMKWEDGTSITNGSTSDGVTITYNDADGFRLFHLNFADDFWNVAGSDTPIPLKTCQFHAVANWGSKITATDDNDRVENLRKLRIDVEKNTENQTEYAFVKTPNVMYGEITDDTPRPSAENPAEVTRVVTVTLKRTAAMITLAMNGEKLDKGIFIELTSVALHNVPASCVLGSTNKAENNTAISKNGDFTGGPSLARGILVGTATQTGLAGFTEDAGYHTTIGGHYKMDNDNNVTVDYDAPIMPLFLYENMQGTGESSENETMKRPTGVNATEEAITAYNETGVCSYIEIIGTYTHRNDDLSIKSRGPVTWRFFLGGNEIDDFNVERNKNYRLTLNLINTGITEADTSWRVDADNLEEPGAVGDTEMVVGGGGEMFCVQPNTDIATDYRNGLKLNGPNADFVYVYTKPANQYIWEKVSLSTGNTKPDEATLDGMQLWFYVQPLLPDDPYNGNERGCTVQFLDNSGKELDPPLTVTFTQYRPVTFSITSADLTTYGTDPDLLEAKRLIKEYYNHDVDTQGEFKFYADRVDRGPLQWGFGGVQLDQNQNTGFENVYHLIDPLDENGKSIEETNTDPQYASCVTHKKHAKNYLPTGRGWKETNGHINYENGSCMIHAAMENYFQQYYPYPGGTDNGVTSPMVTPKQLYEMGLPPRPGSAGDNTTSTSGRQYSWCVPSIVGWKLVEILDRFYKNHNILDRGFDPQYPILKWVSYWTSNAATADLASIYPSLGIDGKNRSFVYQFGIGLDKIGEDDTYPGYLLMNRNTKVRYRLLNIKPEAVSGTTTK